MKEIWKPVVGYEGLYEVSNVGRVRKGIKIKKLTRGSNRYLKVMLLKDTKTKCVYVHRLVGEAFVKRKDNLTQINHKNYDRYNNHADNLEWVSQKDNIKHDRKRLCPRCMSFM